MMLEEIGQEFLLRFGFLGGDGFLLVSPCRFGIFFAHVLMILIAFNRIPNLVDSPPDDSIDLSSLSPSYEEGDDRHDDNKSRNKPISLRDGTLGELVPTK